MFAENAKLLSVQPCCTVCWTVQQLACLAFLYIFPILGGMLHVHTQNLTLHLGTPLYPGPPLPRSIAGGRSPGEDPAGAVPEPEGAGGERAVLPGRVRRRRGRAQREAGEEGDPHGQRARRQEGVLHR